MRITLFSVVLLLLMPAYAAAISSTGYGESRSLALRAALQSAVEQGVGMYMSSSSVVDDVELVKDTMVSHSSGYITSYNVVKESTDADGVWTITIDAKVSRDLLHSHVDMLETLMILGGHPKVAIIPDDGDIAAEPLSTDVYAPMMEGVRNVFRDDFRFDVLSPQALRSAAKTRPTPESIKKISAKMGLQYLVTVSVLKGKDGVFRLASRSVRLQDGVELGAERFEIGTPDLAGLKGRAYAEAVASAVSPKVFPAAIEAAKSVVQDLREQTEGGGGAQYSIILIGFPDVPKVVAGLESVPGFVSLNPTSRDKARSVLDYRSHLSTKELTGHVQQLFTGQGIQVRHKLEGHTLKFKFVDPDAF